MTWTVPAVPPEPIPALWWTVVRGDERARLDGRGDRRRRHDRCECNEGDEECVAEQALALAGCDVLEVAHSDFLFCERCRGREALVHGAGQIES
jgi:hypothetical protein